MGSGIVGTTAALALAKNTSLHVALLDVKSIACEWQDQQYDSRVSAISLAAKNIFQKLNVWEKIINKRVSPYTLMHVWDTECGGEINFNCNDVQQPALGYIIEDSVMRASLYESITQQITVIPFVKLKHLNEKSDGIELVAEDEQVFTAKLIVAADGANSWIREKVGIALKTWDYNHEAIVATVQTKFSHQQTAWQCFMPSGTLAFLPLDNPHYSSIVWSTTPAHSKELLNLSAELFAKKLEEFFTPKLGEVLAVNTRYHFPLRMRHAKNYVKPRIVLMGDAAHTIHPLAGQGVNLGLLDAVALVEVVARALSKQRDFASFATLRQYERWRKGDNIAMLSIVEVLKYFCVNDKKILKSLLSFGLNLTDKTTFAKKFFVNYAMGKRKDLPQMACASLINES